MLSIRLRAFAALLVAGVIGGIAPVFMKFALREYTPFEIVFARFFFSSLILVPLALRKGKILPSRKDIGPIAGAALLFSGNIFLFVSGLRSTTAIASQLLYLLTPAIVLALSWLILKEAAQKKHFFSLAAGFIGGSLLVVKGNAAALASSLGSAQGNLIILGAVLSWSSYLVFSKRLSSRYSPLQILVWNSLFAALLSALLIATGPGFAWARYRHSSTLPVLSLLFLVIFNSLIFFFLYQWVIKHVKPFSASMSSYLGVLATAIVAIPLLGERLSLPLVLSTALILTSSWLAFRRH